MPDGILLLCIEENTVLCTRFGKYAFLIHKRYYLFWSWRYAWNGRSTRMNKIISIMWTPYLGCQRVSFQLIYLKYLFLKHGGQKHLHIMQKAFILCSSPYFVTYISVQKVLYKNSCAEEDCIWNKFPCLPSFSLQYSQKLDGS